MSEPTKLDTKKTPRVIKFMRQVPENDTSRLGKYSLGHNAGFERCRHMIAHCDELFGRPSFKHDLDTMDAKRFNELYKIGATNLCEPLEDGESLEDNIIDDVAEESTESAEAV